MPLSAERRRPGDRVALELQHPGEGLPEVFHQRRACRHLRNISGAIHRKSACFSVPARSTSLLIICEKLLQILVVAYSHSRVLRNEHVLWQQPKAFWPTV